MLLSFLAGVGCATDRPNSEYVLAREAYASAQEVDAAKYSGAAFHKAEEYYKKAVRDYQAQNFNSAVEEFRLSRTWSERAENNARIQRQKAGDEAL